MNPRLPSAKPTAIGFFLKSLLALAVIAAGLSPATSTAKEPAATKSELTVHRDLTYKPDAITAYENERCVLDLYVPAGGAEGGESRPLLVWLHGGNIQGGQKDNDMTASIATSLAEEGVLVASVNYRLNPKVNFPAYLEDVAASVAWAFNHAAEYGGDPKRIYVSGHSAGGYLAAMVGLDDRYLSRYGFTTGDLAGVIPVAGQMVTHTTVREERGIPKTTPVIDAAAPSYHARKETPPILLLVGGDDLPARAEENQYFLAAMKAAGNENVALLVVPHRDHRHIAENISLAGDPAREAVLKFVGLEKTD